MQIFEGETLGNAIIPVFGVFLLKFSNGVFALTRSQKVVLRGEVIRITKSSDRWSRWIEGGFFDGEDGGSSGRSSSERACEWKILIPNDSRDGGI